MAEATGKREVREKIDTGAGPDMSNGTSTTTDKHTSENKGDDETDNKKSSSASDAAEVCKDSDGRSVDNTQGGSITKATAECPNEECGESIPTNKKGQFPKNCPWCNEDLTSLVPNNRASAEESASHQDQIACKQYDIEIQPLTRDSECGYCCLKLIEMEMPRVLLCGHIQCTQCIVVDSQNPEIVCKICKKEYKSAQTAEKHAPESKGETETNKSSSASDTADVCKEDEGSADENKQGSSTPKVAAECPNKKCGESIPRNKKGQFPKNCPWCNEDLTSLVPIDTASAEESAGHQDEIACKQYDIEIQPLTRDSECGYCCLKLIEIEEPRVLPCGHIQCTQCIVVDSQNPEIVCKICKKEFKSAEILVKSLPEVPQVMIELALAEPAPFIPPNLRCEMCKDQPVQATNFCADCKRKLCTNHSEDHVLHTTNHELIAIEDELTPERYEVQRCEKHTIHVLSEICKHCMKLFCKRCDTDAETCTGGDAPGGITDDRASADGSKQNAKDENDKKHKIIPLLEQTTHMRDELRQKSQAIYNKMKRCRDMEKSTWKELSEVEDAVTAAQQEVDTIANDMIRKIKDEADEIKAKFTHFYNDMSAEVDKFSEDKLIGITKLDLVYMEGQQLADRRPDSQLLKDFTDVSARLSLMEKDISFDRQLYINMPYLDRGTSTAVINAQLISAPMSIEYVSTEKKAYFYYGVKWIEGGRVLCSTSSGLEIRLADMTLFQEIKTAGHTFSADLVGDKLYTHESPDEKCITYIGTQEVPRQQKVHEETYEGLTQISVSKEMLAIVDFTNKMLKMITVSGEHMLDIKLKDMKTPLGVQLLPAENSVLVTDFTSGELRKYRLEPDAKPVWICAGLKTPSGVTTGESGLIYVANNNAGKIYVITPQGKKIHELTHIKLTEAIAKKGQNHDVSVSDGKMVVACRQQGVMMFNIK